MSTYATISTPKFTADFRHQIKHSLDKELWSKCEEKKRTKKKEQERMHVAQWDMQPKSTYGSPVSAQANQVFHPSGIGESVSGLS